MNAFRYVFAITFCLLLTFVNAQNKKFELSNPNSILLDNRSLDILTSGYWRVFKDDIESRGSVISTSKNVSMCYYSDGTFFYNGSTGTWEILEDRYIEHQFHNKEEQDRLKFGGVFSITELDNSTLTLTKLLTSSHDMKRTLHLKSSTILTKKEQPNSGGPYFHDGALDESTIDSLSNMDSDELFNAGFTIVGNNMIHIITPDSLYAIKLKRNYRTPREKD